MKKSYAAALIAALLGANPTHAEQLGPVNLSITPGIISDYVLRGVSQTRSSPALQTSVVGEHSSGLYVGGLVSNVDFKATDVRVEADLIGGYRTTLSGVRLDLGGTYRSYPGYSPETTFGRNLNWGELGVRATHDVGPVVLNGQIMYTPNFRLDSGQSIYTEGGADYLISSADVVISGRLGYTSIRNNTRAGLTDYWNWSAVMSKEIQGFNLNLGYYDTDIVRSDCFGGQSACSGRVVAGVSRRF
jgi:uncharacterized protein (TIGR02001 family)